jgi:hypothetical protein
MARKGRGVPPGKGKVLVPPPGKGKGKVVPPPTGKPKGKAVVPPMKGATVAPPPRPMRGRVVTVPVLPIGPPPGRGMGPPPPGRGVPPRMTPPPMAAETPRAERLEGTAAPLPRTGRGAALMMKQRGIAPTMAALRAGKVAF